MRKIPGPTFLEAIAHIEETKERQEEGRNNGILGQAMFHKYGTIPRWFAIEVQSSSHEECQIIAISYSLLNFIH